MPENEIVLQGTGGYVIGTGVAPPSTEPAVVLRLKDGAGTVYVVPLPPRNAREIAAGLDEAAGRIERKLRGDA
jgi:hypothetical protein